MPAKVLLTIQKGGAAGQTFTFEGKENLIIGRKEDSSIVLPEFTVSRYHCLIDIVPPSVMVRDFGSLNGTYLNGKKIGQRKKDDEVEEARKNRGQEFAMKSGDRLGLGKDCELKVEVILPQYCSKCLNEMDDSEHVNDEGLPICHKCHKKFLEEQKEKEDEKERILAQKKAEELAAIEKAAVDAKAKEEAKKALLKAEAKAAELMRLAEEAKKKRVERKCKFCRKPVDPSEPLDICEDCQNDPEKVLQIVLAELFKTRDKAPDAGKVVGYRQIKKLGEGGMGEVWQVEEEETGQQMAMKLMLSQVANSEASRDIFLREANIAGQLEHENIVRQFKCGNYRGTYFILMELCDGGSVDALMKKKNGPLSVDMASNIILQVLDGLIYAHQKLVIVRQKNGTLKDGHGVVHRDLKPGNIFLKESGRNMVAKVADFGLAKAFETAGLSGHTRTGQVAGSPGFMARQQIINYKYSKPEIDVWAAAASFYFMLTATIPKNIGHGEDAFHAGLTNDAVPIRERNSNIPAKLAKVIDQALIEKPKIGIQSAKEFKQLLEKAL
jgi:serine/threonine-protein kinase